MSVGIEPRSSKTLYFRVVIGSAIEYRQPVRAKDLNVGTELGQHPCAFLRQKATEALVSERPIQNEHPWWMIGDDARELGQGGRDGVTRQIVFDETHESQRLFVPDPILSTGNVTSTRAGTPSLSKPTQSLVVLVDEDVLGVAVLPTKCHPIAIVDTNGP